MRRHLLLLICFLAIAAPGFSRTTVPSQRKEPKPIQQIATHSRGGPLANRKDVPITSVPADGHSYVLEFYPSGTSKDKAETDTAPQPEKPTAN